MEAYGTIAPVAAFATDDDDPIGYTTNYATMSQFDFDLQQQALQQSEWQGLDLFLPQIDCQSLFCAPTTAAPTVANSSFSSQQQQPAAQTLDTTTTTTTTTTSFGIQQNVDALNPIAYVDNTTNNGLYQTTFADYQAPKVTAQAFISPPLFSFDAITPVVASQWSTESDFQREAAKAEYPSPEHIGSSPLSDTKPDLSTNTTSQPTSLAGTITPATGETHPCLPKEEQALHNAALPGKPAATINDVPPEVSWDAPFRGQQGKIPIQRLKPALASTTTPMAASSPKTTAATTPNGGRQHKKSSHNAIERRYRNNINERIAELRDAVPALLHAKLKESRSGKRSQKSMDDDDDDGEDGEEYLDGVAVATKLNKATILRKATEYIMHLKKTGEDMRQENALLQHLLTQLPGGPEALARYRMQKLQREQEWQRRQMQERQQAAKTQRQRNSPRKRARTNGDESSPSSSSSSGAVTPPAVTNRVFMALFMCLTFFSSAPLTAGPSSAEQFRDHHHVSRAADVDSAELSAMPQKIVNDATKGSVLDSFIPLASWWETLRTIIFVLSLVHLFFPWIKSRLFTASFRVKRVPRTKRFASMKQMPALSSSYSTAVGPVTLGEQKCNRIYDIVARSLEMENDAPPRNTLVTFYSLLKETGRLVARHVFGYEILHEEDNRLVAEDEWEQACRWLKLNEMQCLGGNPESTRWTTLHSCVRMLNLVEELDEDEHEHIEEIRSRAYATAAMQFALIVPHRGLAKQLSQHFWRLAVYESTVAEESDHGFDDTYTESVIRVTSQHETFDDILKSRAWRETLTVMQGEMGQGKATGTLSLSLTAPVIVPLVILSTLQLLDSLRHEYGRLIASIADNTPESVNSVTTDTSDCPAFESMLSVTQGDQDNYCLPQWLAAVGLAVEALWKNDAVNAKKWMATVVKPVPRALLVEHSAHQRDIVTYKTKMSRLDELLKRSIVLTLAGAVLIKDGRVSEGVVQLEQAERVRATIKKLQSKHKRNHMATFGLENEVLAMAEFAVAMLGLEAWISALRLAPTMSDKESYVRESIEQVRSAILHLRRMIRQPCLEGLKVNQVIVERLTRLGRFMARQPDEVDSACHCSDLELDDEADMISDTLDEPMEIGQDELLVKRAEKALYILHGVM